MARQPDQVIINKTKKRTCRIVVPDNYRVKLNDGQKKDKYLDLARELKKKTTNMKVTVTPIIIGALSTVTKRIGTGTGGIGNKRTSGDHPNDRIIKIGQNTEESPGDLWKLSVIQTLMKNLSANAGVKNS